MTEPTPGPLTGLLEKIAERSSAGEAISIETVQAVAGQRAAGPLLFFPAMVVVSPLSLIPTLPTIIALIVILIAGQLVLGLEPIRLPKKLRSASLSPERATKAIDFLRPVARWLERWSKPRLKFLTSAIGVKLSSIVCIMVALTMPPLEFFPGASTTAGTVIAAFGLSLTTRDGFLLLLALSLVIGFGSFIFWLFF